MFHRIEPVPGESHEEALARLERLVDQIAAHLEGRDMCSTEERRQAELQLKQQAEAEQRLAQIMKERQLHESQRVDCPQCQMLHALGHPQTRPYNPPPMIDPPWLLPIPRIYQQVTWGRGSYDNRTLGDMLMNGKVSASDPQIGSASTAGCERVDATVTE